MSASFPLSVVTNSVGPTSTVSSLTATAVRMKPNLVLVYNNL